MSQGRYRQSHKREKSKDEDRMMKGDKDYEVIRTRTTTHTTIRTTTRSSKRRQHSAHQPASVKKARYDDIVSIAPPPKNIARVMTESMEDMLRKTMNHHHLPDHQHVGPPHQAKCRGHSVMSIESEVEPDGKLKLLRKGPKSAWDISDTRQWDGVRLNGETYWIGDGVLINKMTETGKAAERGLIRRVTEIRSTGKSRVTLHIHWLKSLAVGQENELFLHDLSCQDVSLSSLQRKLNFVLLKPEEERSRHLHKGLFCRLVAQTDHRLRDYLPPHQNTQGCDSCARKAMLATQPYVNPLLDVLRLRIGDERDTLHEHDFVMIDSRQTGIPFIIGQIESCCDPVTIEVRILGRHSLFGREGPKDERRLFLTDQYRKVSATDIRGRCHVVLREELISASDSHAAFHCPDRLYEGSLTPLKRLACCEACTEERRRRILDNKAFARASRRLDVADYYSGAGGGVLSARPFFRVTTAVEMNPVACSTLSNNHPGTKVCMGKVDDLHRRELQREEGGRVDEVYEPGDENRPGSRRTKVPLLPARGSLVGMMAGVPCQGHSRTNMYQTPDDDRNLELFRFMSEVDRIRPGYVILENVPGFKDAKSDTFAAGAPTKSFASVAMALLVKHDYQAQLAVLDSRSYGSPQNRARLWIIAARRGLPMPRVPQPTHANPLVKATVFSMEGDSASLSQTSGYLEDGTPGTGPYPAVTVEDAIGDLPEFDFLGPTTSSKHDRPAFDATRIHGQDTKVGFTAPTRYRTPPQTLYQMIMRGNLERVIDHFTPSRSQAEVVKCHLAFQSLPAETHGSERKLEPGDGFATLMTSNAPGRRATRPIHYSQRRTKTVLEDKRAMGFPDDYRLSGTPQEQIAQMGNAWVVQMGQAIVREIHNVIRDEWTKDGRPEDAKSWWDAKYPVAARPKL